MSETPRTDAVPSEESRIKRLREWAHRALLRQPGASIIERTIAEDVQHLEAKYQRENAAMREQLASLKAPVGVAGVIALCRRSLDRDVSTLTSEQALASQCLSALESLAAQVAFERNRANAINDRFQSSMDNSDRIASEWMHACRRAEAQLAERDAELAALYPKE